MRERRFQELDLVRKRYGEIEYGENLDWVIIKKFIVPSGWNCEVTRILIILPAGYPITPPDNFFVEPGTALASGECMAGYSESVSQIGQSWGQFSHHVDPTSWKPSGDIVSGDNLLTFMLSVERRFAELNRWPN